MATNGYVLWQGASPATGAPIVAIVTMKSRNRKTGDMAQLWILRADIAPTAALATGADDAICGACPLRGDGSGKARACYVTVARAPLSVWKAYRRGAYATAGIDDLARILSGRKVRLGAYGDPAMLPLELVQAIVSASAGATGYTHQWRAIDPAWSALIMASADSVADRRDARAMGYRTFYVVPKGTDIASLSGAVECLATRKRKPLQCADCLVCSGTRNGTVARATDVVIVAHGSGARFI